MPVTYVYPDSTTLRAIEQDLVPVIEQSDPVFNEIFPVENADTFKLEWEQLDNFYGLQAARGLDGQPSKVARLGSNRFETEPGIYGEFVDIEEQELVRRAAIAKFEGVIDIQDLVMQAQRQLLQRRFDRIRYIGWTLLTTGKFMVAAPNGGYEHRDQYALETITASPAFSSRTTATPFSFFLSLLTKGRGTSAKFGPDAKIYFNAVTIQNILLNSNAADRAGIRLDYGATLNKVDDINAILKGYGLPTIAVYDEGYLTGSDASTFVPFIPDSVGVLIGKRTTGTPVGAYRMTINAHNGFQSGAYTQVFNTYGSEAPGVAKLQVHDGHNGGPVLFFPKACKILSV